MGDLSVTGSGAGKPPSAQNNIGKAVAIQKGEEVKQSEVSAKPSAENDDEKQVRGFLQAINLEKYFDKFVEHGVEDMETILELRDEHVEQMGVPLGHKLKIVKRIKDLRTEKGMSVP